MKPMKAATARSTTTAAHGQTLPHQLPANAIQIPVASISTRPALAKIDDRSERRSSVRL